MTALPPNQFGGMGSHPANLAFRFNRGLATESVTCGTSAILDRLRHHAPFVKRSGGLPHG